MPELKELTERIESTWEAMKAKNDEVLAESKAVSLRMEEYRGEDQAQLVKMSADMDATKATLDEIGLKQARQIVPATGAQSMTQEEADRQKAYNGAFFKWARGGTREMSADDLKTLRNAHTPERKALVENTAGLYLVPEDMEAEIMRAVPQINTLRGLCRVRTTTRERVKINSLTELSVGWGKLETGASTNESSATPTTDSIIVEDLYGLTKLGEDELMDTDANLAAIMADSFAVAIANEENKRFAIGRGHTTYTEPDGVAVDATIIASYDANWTTADTASIDDMLTCEYSLPDQYLSGSSWLMRRNTELAVRLLRAEVASGYYGNYLWQPSLQIGQPNNFDGFPIFNQNDMNYPADATAGINVIFGNFKLGYMIVDRAGIAIQRLDELYAEAGLVGFKVHKRVGGGVYRPRAFQGIYNNT